MICFYDISDLPPIFHVFVLREELRMGNRIVLFCALSSSHLHDQTWGGRTWSVSHLPANSAYYYLKISFKNIPICLMTLKLPFSLSIFALNGSSNLIYVWHATVFSPRPLFERFIGIRILLASRRDLLAFSWQPPSSPAASFISSSDVIFGRGSALG